MVVVTKVVTEKPARGANDHQSPARVTLDVR